MLCARLGRRLVPGGPATFRSLTFSVCPLSLVLCLDSASPSLVDVAAAVVNGHSPVVGGGVVGAAVASACCSSSRRHSASCWPSEREASPPRAVDSPSLHSACS